MSENLAWQEKLRDAEADLAAGRVRRFADDDEFLRHLDAIDDESGQSGSVEPGYETGLAQVRFAHCRQALCEHLGLGKRSDRISPMLVRPPAT